MAEQTPPEPTPTATHTLSFTLPHSTTNLHIHLTPLAHTLLLFLTTTTPSSSLPPPLGSFIYAIPSRTNEGMPLTTPLYLREGTVEFATRMAKVLCKRAGKPVYVGWSGEMSGAAGTVEEEVQGWREVVDAVMGIVGKQGELSPNT